MTKIHQKIGFKEKMPNYPPKVDKNAKNWLQRKMSNIRRILAKIKGLFD
jgi:hypothetical protein